MNYTLALKAGKAMTAAAAAERSRKAARAWALGGCSQKHLTAMTESGYFPPALNSSFCLAARGALGYYAGV